MKHNTTPSYKKVDQRNRPCDPQSVHPLLDQEALRVVGQMPRWFPATTDKGTVRVKYTVPISFKL